MDHLDVVTAFLNPEIDDDDIYMTLPEGWPEGLNAPKIIVRLRKALYGLKQAPRLWHDDINAFLLSPGFTQSSADPSVSNGSGSPGCGPGLEPDRMVQSGLLPGKQGYPPGSGTG